MVRWPTPDPTPTVVTQDFTSGLTQESGLFTAHFSFLSKCHATLIELTPHPKVLLNTAMVYQKFSVNINSYQGLSGREGKSEITQGWDLEAPGDFGDLYHLRCFGLNHQQASLGLVFLCYPLACEGDLGNSGCF